MGLRASGNVIGLACLACSGCSLLTSFDGFGGNAPDAADSPVDGGASYPSAVLADNPIAYWRLGEKMSLKAHDQTSHGNDGTYAMTCTLGVVGALQNDTNTAVDFDGASSTVEIPAANLDFTGLTPFTVEGWVKVALLGTAFQHVINHESQAAPREGYALLIGFDNHLEFERFVDDQGITLTGPVAQAETWTYVVGTYDGVTLTLYVNAVPFATDLDRRPAKGLADPFYLGAGETQKFYNGEIDEVAVYREALSATRVAAHYHASGR